MKDPFNQFPQPANVNLKKNSTETDLKVELGKKFKGYLLESKDFIDSPVMKNMQDSVNTIVGENYDEYYKANRDVTVLIWGIKKLTDDPLFPKDKRVSFVAQILNLQNTNPLSHANGLTFGPQSELSLEDSINSWVNNLKFLIKQLDGLIPDDMVRELEARQNQFLQSAKWVLDNKR